jgi:hypothetical protein
MVTYDHQNIFIVQATFQNMFIVQATGLPALLSYLPALLVPATITVVEVDFFKQRWLEQSTSLRNTWKLPITAIALYR